MKHLSKLLTLALLLSGFSAYGQITKGEIFGTVTDPNGDTLPGVSISVTSPALQGQRSAVTNGQGFFRLPLLPMGTYRVSYVFTGFRTVVRENIVVKVGEKTRSDAKLFTDTLEQEMIVTADTPLIDVSTTDSKTELGSDYLESVPTLQRTIEDVAKLTPGVSGVYIDTVNGTNSGLPSMRGGGQEGNQYTVDGVSSRGSIALNSNLTQNFDSIETLQIVSDPFSPEFGKSLGGAINVVTKSGSNEFAGEAGFQYRNDSLEASRKAVQTTNTTTGLDRNKLWANLGGPIIKDKVWFFRLIQPR